MSYRVFTDVSMPMRDGCKLYADIYRPDGDGPFPVLFQRLPYDKSQVRYQSSALNIFTALRRGYAIVSQDVRGRFKSEGEFRPFVNEGLDGYDSCNWIVQQAWCNGSIGMFGASYLGDVQWLAASHRPSGLKAIAPQMTPGDAYERWFYQGGAFQLGLNLLWACRLAIGKAKRLQTLDSSDSELVSIAISNLDSVCDLYEQTPLRDVQLQHQLVPEYQEWLDHPVQDEFWQSIQDAKDLDQILIPVFSLGGFHDVFLESTITNHLRAVANSTSQVRSHSRLVLGPWAHGTLSGEFPERSYGLRSSFDGADLTGAQLDWFDEILSDSPSSRLNAKPVSVFAQGIDQWVHFSEWPPSESEEVKYYLDSNGSANSKDGDGQMVRRCPDASFIDELKYDPSDPVPTWGGRTFLPGLFIGANSGQRDQSRIEERMDVLCYTGERLSTSVLLAGRVRAKVYLSADVVDTDLTVKIVDVDQDDIPWNVVDGILRLRYRDSFDQPEMMETGQVYEVVVDVGSVVYMFSPGHRLRVEVSASNFPRFDRNTNTGSRIATEALSESNIARIRIQHSPVWPSHVSLPVVRELDQLDWSAAFV